MHKSFSFVTQNLWCRFLCGIHAGLNLANKPGRIARDYCKVGNTLCNNAPGADNAALPNSDSWQDAYIPSNPTVFPNMDFLAELWTLSAVANGRVKGMSAGIEAAIWTHKRTRADSDEAGIQKNGIEVDKDVLTKTNVVAVVHCHWWLDPRVIFKQLVVFLC